MSHPTRSVFALAAAVLLPAMIPARAMAQEIYLDLVEPAPKSAAATANCSTWHELFPTYCAPHHQDDYVDNGDGLVTACDFINLDGHWFHIKWSGPTYFLSCGTDPRVFEPTEPGTGGDPTCEIWREVHPNNGTQLHVDGWQDNGDGVLSECDFVLINGLTCHIDRIGLNIVVEPGEPDTPTESSSWGGVKRLFEAIF